jgi:hypothetical protein
MSREIKFRAWDIKYKRMIDDLHITASDASINTFLNLADYTMMQYTGLKDKNGTEIYESDIVTEFGEIKIVEWTAEGLGWQFRAISKMKPMNYSSYIEVIGNIYENKELLS